jgi:hypothetical protein
MESPGPFSPDNWPHGVFTKKAAARVSFARCATGRRRWFSATADRWRALRPRNAIFDAEIAPDPNSSQDFASKSAADLASTPFSNR